MRFTLWYNQGNMVIQLGNKFFLTSNQTMFIQKRIYFVQINHFTPLPLQQKKSFVCQIGTIWVKNEHIRGKKGSI